MKIEHKVILGFLKDWLDWAKKGAPDDGFYLAGWGLCSNLDTYLYHHYDGYDDLHYDVVECFSGEMLGGMAYPFGERSYSRRSCDDTQYKCPKRLKWVREKIKELEEEEANAL